MGSDEKRRVAYPFSKGGLYVSVVLAVLSVSLALLFLMPDVILLVYYVLTATLVTVFVFALKIGLISIYISKLLGSLTRQTTAQQNQEEAGESSREGTNWRAIFLLLAMILVVLFTPMILTQFLNPYIWFVLLISFTSGISFGDIFFYFYTTK